MNVVKRSEYCKIGVSGEVKKGCVSLVDIPRETVFRARIGEVNDPHVFLKTTDKAVCIGETGRFTHVGEYSNRFAANSVYDYEALNATLVIEGE